ncbi:MAG: hypothetical protein V1664_02615 [Candidatus Uhrbacteria bacterium]
MLSEHQKKILLILAFVISVIGIGTLLYFMFFAPSSGQISGPIDGITGGNITGQLPSAQTGTPTAITTPSETTENLPEAAEIANGGLTKTNILTTGSVSGTSLSLDGKNMNYYDTKDNRFYTINTDGTYTKLSNKQFPDAENISWNTGGDKAVIEFPDGSNVVYDFTSEIQVTLPKHWEEFEFSPANDEIIAKSIGLDPDSRAIVVSNDDGSQVRAVQALGENADKVQINPSPNDQIIAFSDTGDVQVGGLDRRMIIPVGKNKENFKGLVVEGLGFEAIWNTRGSTILYSVYGSFSNNKPLLWVVDGSANSLGGNRRSLGLNTWVDKCVFTDATTAYCAVPQDLPNNSGFQPSMYKNTSDDVYKINLTSGSSNLIARPAESTCLKNLFISDDGSTLYYSNALNNRLEYIKLK